MQNRVIKIDDKGNYCSFPGVTVVSAIKTEDYQFWKELYNLLDKCELTKQYYSWLPFESYHMTTMNLYTMSDIGSTAWEGFIVENLPKFQKTAKLIDQNSFSPEIELEELLIGKWGVILINLKLPTDQQGLIGKVAEELGHLDKIPDGLHITLGYCYKQLTDEIYRAIKEELKPVLSFMGKKFQLDAPKLCYFNDMTNFIPWEADKYPF